MSSEASSASSWLTQYHLVDPETAYGNIIGSITSGERITLKARTSAGMGKISVEAATVNVEALFTELERVVEADLFGSTNSPNIEARGTTNYPNFLDSNDKTPLTVIFQQSGNNKISSGHFFLTQ